MCVRRNYKKNGRLRRRKSQFWKQKFSQKISRILFIIYLFLLAVKGDNYFITKKPINLILYEYCNRETRIDEIICQFE